MARSFRANTPAVASEIIDGEAVIMNLRSGEYFSTKGTGSQLWDWLDRGVAEPDMVEALARVYPEPGDQIGAAVARFIDELERHDLIRPQLHSASAGEIPVASSPTGPFVAPQLEVYTDMQDLLLLDPIHDVDEQEGWPAPKPQGDASA